jgi:potassium-dependent mechanosensitive channel
MEELDPEKLARVSVLFEALDDEGRMALLSSSSKRTYFPRTLICREGERGEEFFVIAKGRVRISSEGLDGEKELAVLHAGTFFGEMAALGGHVRSATATALDHVELVVFPFDAVLSVLRTRPAALEVLARVGMLRSELNVQKMME